MKTYLFYDLETSGLNIAFDQILQFAAIRTDENFQEIERMEYFFRFRPDVLPSPNALLVNKIPWRFIETGLLEYEGVLKIFEAINQPQTISIGYNNLNFDDEFLRFTFYRNLLDPYQHQYANQCYRMDLFPMVLFYYLYYPDKLTWCNDKPLKLENLVIANQLNISRSAHDALGDVEATLLLAKKLKEDYECWQYLESNFDKVREENRILRRFSISKPTGWLINSNFGYQSSFMKPAYCLGRHYHYKNQTIWLPLDIELEKQIPFEHSYPIHKKFGEPPFWLPLIDKYGSIADVVTNNLLWIKEHNDWLCEVKNYYLDLKYPVISDLLVEASLYQDGLWNGFEKKAISLFHHATNFDEKLAILNNAPERIKTLGMHLLYRNYPELLDTNSQQRCFDYFQQIWYSEKIRTNYRNQNYYTPNSWQQEFDKLSDVDKKTLQNLKLWIDKQKKQYKQKR